MDQRPIFSLCHTTARLPAGWLDAAQTWLARCDDPSRVEYILCAPEELRINAAISHGPVTSSALKKRFDLKLVTVPTRNGSVAGWNAAAKASTGHIIIAVADDFFPCEHWDTELLKAARKESWPEFVIAVDSGEQERHILTHPIMSRARYERFGYLNHPDYLGVVADDEFTIQSYRDGVVIDARHLKFEHRHHHYGMREPDALDKMQHSSENWRVGRQALAKHMGGGRPTFSLVHATARVPDGWRGAAVDWISKAAYPEQLEHILCTDEGDRISERGKLGIEPWQMKHVINKGRKCAVDAWNCAAAASSGRVLITVADDWKPCLHWDLELLKVIPDLSKPYVVWINSGGDHSIMTFSILTRAQYEKYGYIFYPEYIGMFADNDFTEVALRDKVVIDCRERLPIFQHFHPEYGTAESDAIYERQHRPEAWRIGQAVFNRRSANGFKGEAMKPKADQPLSLDRRVGLLLPNKEKDWLASIFSNQAMLNELGFQTFPILGYTSGTTDITRIEISKLLLKYHQDDQKMPYLFWIDDDNIVPVETVKRWVEFMEATPQCDILVGWCWIVRGEDWICSVGTFNDDGTLNHYILRDVFSNGQAIRHVPNLGSGFPAVMMRREVLETLGPNAFQRIPNAKGPYGFIGEDLSFFWRAKEKGMRCYFDPLGKLGHLQLDLQEPKLTIAADAPAELRRKIEKVTGKAVEGLEALDVKV